MPLKEGALVALISAACSTASQRESAPPTEVPTATPQPIEIPATPGARPPQLATNTPESAPAPEVRTNAWREPVALGENFLLTPGEHFLIPEYNPSSLWTGDRLFVRNPEGYVQELQPETGASLWTSERRGAPVAGDSERLYIQDEENFRIYIYNTEDMEGIGKIYPWEGLSPEQLPRLYRGGELIGDVLIVYEPFGFTVYDRDGKPLWQTSRDFREKLSALVGDKFLIETEDWLLIRDKTDGHGFFIPVFQGEKGPTYTYDERYLVTLGPKTTEDEVDPETPAFHIYDLRTWEEIAQAEPVPGFTNPTWIKIIEGERIYPNREEETLLILAEQLQVTGSRIQYAYASASIGLESGQIFDVDPDYEPEYSNRRMLLHGIAPNRLLGYDYPPGTTIGASLSEPEDVWANEEVAGIKYLGLRSGNLIFTNWDYGLSSEYDWGRPKIYGLDPETGEELWRVEIDTQKRLEAVVREDAIVVVGEEIIKIDPRTGEKTTLAVPRVPAKKVTDTGNWVLVETENNELYAVKP